MRSHHHRCAGSIAGLILSAGVLAAAPTAPVVPASDNMPASDNVAAKAAKQSEHIAQLIDGLLKHRLKPDPLPMTLPNPFVVVSGGIVARHEDGPGPEVRGEGETEKLPASPEGKVSAEAPASSAEVLARCAATLKIGGIIRLKDQAVQIVVNGVPRKEGDFIVLEQDQAVVRLQLARIMSGMILVRLNEAEQTIRF